LICKDTKNSEIFTLFKTFLHFLSFFIGIFGVTLQKIYNMKNTELIPLQIEDKIIEIRNQNAILDSDVATLYGVQTKDVNRAVANNPDKFPNGFIFELTDLEADLLRLKILTLNKLGRGQHKKYLPKAFTEQGLYMLATILKSPRATQATLTIISTFAKIRELSRTIAAINSMDSEVIEPEIIETTGGLLNDLFFSGLPTSAETTIEFNIGVMKGKRKIKYEKPIYQSEFDELKRMVSELKQQNEKLLQKFTSTNK